KGKLSAGEFYSVTSNKNVALYGIENKDLYKENIEEFRRVCEAGQRVSKDIRALLKVLNQIQDRIDSPELKALESNSVLKGDGSISFTERWRYVDSLASRLNISYDGYVNLKKLVESIKLEKSISFELANKERDLLIDAISRVASKADLEKLVLKSLSFKQGKISQSEYYLLLQGLAKEYSIDPAPYKNLIDFTDYITIYESIDLLEIFEEAKLLEDSIRGKLYVTPDQKKLHDIIKCVHYIKDIFELKLTNSDFEYLNKNINVCNQEAIAGFIRHYDDDSGYDLDNIFSNIPVAISFYKTAERRNNAILENTIARMNKEGQSVAALITGGYHTKGMSALLKQKETSYIVILPKFDASKGERPYVAILTNKAENYSGQLESGKYRILTEDCIKDSLQDPMVIEEFINDIIVTNLKEAKKDGKNVHAIAGLWIENYRAAYEDLKARGIVNTGQSDGAKGQRFQIAQNNGDAKMGDRNLAATGNFATPPPQAIAGRINAVANEIDPAGTQRAQTPPVNRENRFRTSGLEEIHRRIAKGEEEIIIMRLSGDDELLRNYGDFDAAFERQFDKQCGRLGIKDIVAAGIDKEKIIGEVRKAILAKLEAVQEAKSVEMPARTAPKTTATVPQATTIAKAPDVTVPAEIAPVPEARAGKIEPPAAKLSLLEVISRRFIKIFFMSVFMLICPNQLLANYVPKYIEKGMFPPTLESVEKGTAGPDQIIEFSKEEIPEVPPEIARPAEAKPVMKPAKESILQSIKVKILELLIAAGVLMTVPFGGKREPEEDSGKAEDFVAHFSFSLTFARILINNRRFEDAITGIEGIMSNLAFILTHSSASRKDVKVILDELDSVCQKFDRTVREFLWVGSTRQQRMLTESSMVFSKINDLRMREERRTRSVRAGEVPADIIAARLIREGWHQEELQHLIAYERSVPEPIQPQSRVSTLSEEQKRSDEVSDMVQKVIKGMFGKNANIEHEEYLKLLEAVAAKMPQSETDPAAGQSIKRLTNILLLIYAAGILYRLLICGASDPAILVNALIAMPIAFSMAYIGGEKILGNVGTKNASTEWFYSNYLDVLIKRDMENERFVKLEIREDGLQIVSMGRNASAIDEKLTAKINTISNELEGYLKNNKDLVGCRIDLTEPFKTGGRAYLHPHLLAVSGMATDWLIAHSGIRGGEGKYIYMRRAFFEDIDINILKDVLVRQLEYLREKYNAFRHDKPAPEWMVDVKEELLNAVKPLIRDELEEVRRYDVRISSEYALDKDVVANAVKQITLVSESDGLKDFGPIQKLSDDIKTFQIFIENHDLFQAISIWGKISYEIKLLEERPDEKGEIIKGHPNMMMFKGLASGVNAVVEKYISANGLINKNGILSGKSVGRLVIVTDPDKVMASLAAAKGDEIWVIPYLPARSNIFEGQGLIISIDGDEHSKDTAIEKGIPFAIVPNGVELLKNLNDKLCMMRVEGDGSVRVRLATDQEIKEKDVFVKIPIEKVINIPPAIIGKNLSYDLSDTCESHLQFIGSKSTNAGMMQNEGIPVPEGFALTFAAWNVFETHNAIGSRIEELRNGIKVIPKQTVNAGGRTIVQAGVVTTDAKELSQTLASIREIIINGEMPKEVETEILKKIHALREKYEEIYGKDFSFYVRSSFNFEDLPEEKAAGHYESYPNGEFRSTVTDHEILKAVKLVWASKWNEAAFRLRVKEGISDDTVLPGVLIQIPIKAAIAGKMSTAHVVAESRNEIEIKASRGQGSGVVDKHGAPALAIINKYSKEVEIRNSRSDVDTEDVFLDGTMETRDTTADGFKSDILTEDLCRALAEKGEDIETIFGGNPQDIEWVIDRSGRVWFVQSRPMPEFKSYEVAMMGGLLHKSYLDDVLGLIKEEALEEAARYKKEADIDGLISMLKSVKGKSGENTALWHMVFSYLNMLVKNPAVKEKITAEQLDEIVTFTKENLNTAFVTDMCITFLSSIDNDISRGAIKEFFKSAFVDISRGAIFHLTRLAAVKGFVKHDMAEEVLAMTERLYKDNYEKDKARADKILVSILDFRDPRIVPLLRKFQSDYTGDIQEAATRMINRIESQPAAQVDRMHQDGLGERGSVPVDKAILLGALAAAGLFIYHIFSIPAWLGPVTIALAGAVAMARFVKWQDMPDPFQKPKAGIFKGVEVVEIGVGNYFPSKLTIRKDIWDELSKTPEDIENLKLVLGTDIEKLFESWAVFKNENHGTRIITTGNGVEGVIYVSLNTPIMIDGSRISILKVTGALPLMKKDFILNHSQGAGNERLDVILDKSGQPCLVAAPAKIMPTGAMLASDAEEEASVLIECEPKKPEDKVLTDLYVGHGRYSGNFFRRKQDAPKTDIGYLVTGLEGSWMDSDYYLNPSFIPGNISVKNLEEQGAVTAMPKTTRGTFGREIDQGKILYRTLGEHIRILHDVKRIRHGFPSMLYQNETIGLKRLGDGYLPILRRFAAGFDSDPASPKITGSIDMRAAQRFLDVAVIIYEATENGYTDCVESFLEGYFNHLDRRNDLGDAIVFDEMLNQCLDRGSTGLVTGINMMLEKEVEGIPLTSEGAYFGNMLASLSILEEGRDDLPPAGPSSFGKIGPAFLGVLLALSGTILPAVILLLRELRDTKFSSFLGVFIPTLSGGMFIVEPGRTVDPALLISSQTPVERALEIVKYREGMNRGVVRLLHLRDDKAMFRGFCPIAGEHDGIVDFIDLVEEADLRGPYPILVINFDPHHDAYEVDKDIVHKGNWKTHVEKRGSAIVVTVPVADGMDTKGGLSGKDGNMLPPRGSVDPIDSRDLSAQDYARIPELKDLTVTLPDGSSRRIQDYPGMIWVSMDFDTWSLTRHKQGITYHLNPEKVSEQMAYIADYFKIHGIAVDEMLGFQSYEFLDGGDNKDVWLENVGRLFRKRRGEILQPKIQENVPPRPVLSGKSRYHPDRVVATFTGTKEFSWQSIPDEYLDDDIRMLVRELARLSGKDVEDIQYQDFNNSVFGYGENSSKTLAGMLNFIEKRYPDIKTSGEAYRKVRRVLGLKVRQEYESWSEVAKIIFGDKTTPGMAESRYIEDYVIENGLTRGEMAALVDLAKEGNEAAVRTIMRSFYTKISKFIRYYEGKFVGENRHGSLDSAVLEDYIEKRFKTVILKADPESEQFDYLARNAPHDVSRQFVQRKTRKVRIGKEPLSFLEAPEGDDEFEHTILAKGSSPVTRMFAEDIRRVYDGALRALGFSALDINIYFEHEFDGNSFDLIAARRKDIAASMPVKTKYPTTKWAVI
ncbi:MAG: PEP/pyruvate-binding domain-containing protein, partial [Candidatus Omnitrophica bacterium]|nr:PEP/pyruvate-binding domain-containing protein [Candidatus Omnitrophota bacterium]